MDAPAAVTDQPAACYAHPDVTGGLMPCRTCSRVACDECRESHFGSGIPFVFCAECVADQRRRRLVRRFGAVSAFAAVLVVLALVLNQGLLFIPGAILVLSLALRIALFRAGWSLWSPMSLLRRGPWL